MDTNQLRSAVVAGLETAGEQELAARAASPLSTGIVRQRELPGGAIAGLFEAYPHPSTSFYAGLAGGRVFYLTGQPDQFADMVQASGLHVTDEPTAADLAREYVETTRTFETFTTVLDSADTIRWRTSPPAPDVAAQLRQAVHPPAATTTAPGHYQVSLFVLHGDAIEHRVLTITTNGTVTQHTEHIIPNLPVPISF